MPKETAAVKAKKAAAAARGADTKLVKGKDGLQVSSKNEPMAPTVGQTPEAISPERVVNEDFVAPTVDPAKQVPLHVLNKKSRDDFDAFRQRQNQLADAVKQKVDEVLSGNAASPTPQSRAGGK